MIRTLLYVGLASLAFASGCYNACERSVWQTPEQRQQCEEAARAKAPGAGAPGATPKAGPPEPGAASQPSGKLKEPGPSSQPSK